MSGAPKTEARVGRAAGPRTLRPAPFVVLVEPQLGENIGAVARAMLNFGLSDLRLVRPRDGWPNERASATASGADAVIEATRVFADLKSAVADCAYVAAMTARPRDSLLPVLTPEAAALAIKPVIEAERRAAILIGAERAGLSADDLLAADAIVMIPTNPAFASLNIAQAALVIAYEWAKADGRLIYAGDLAAAGQATKEEFQGLVDHLFAALDDAHYFYPPEKRAVMERNLTVALSRAKLTGGETRTLRGVVKALASKRGATGPDLTTKAQGRDECGD